MTPEWLISSGRERERCDSRNTLPHWEFIRRGLFWVTAAQHGQCMWACTGTKISWIKPNTSSQQVCFYLWEKSYFVFGFVFFPSLFFSLFHFPSLPLSGRKDFQTENWEPPINSPQICRTLWQSRNRDLRLLVEAQGCTETAQML